MSILEKIYSASLKLLAPLSTVETYEAIVREAAGLVDGEHGSIHLAEKEELRRVYATSPSFYSIKVRKNGIRYKVFKDRVPTVIHTPKHEVLKRKYPGLKELAGRSIILIPLYY